MIMLHILLERMPEGTFSKQDEPRERFLLHGAYPALGVGVQIRRPRRQGHPLDSGGVDHLLKDWAVLPISVMDEVLPGSQEAPFVHRDVPRHLHHPRLIGMRCHARDMDLTAAQMDEKEHVIGHQPTPCPHLGGEEVGGYQHLHVRADKLLPRRGGLTLWRRWEAMALEDIADRLVADGVPKVGEGVDNAVIPPGTILLRQTHHQSLDLLVDRGAAGSLALLGAVKLLGDQLAVPAENRVGFDDLRHFLQGLLPQLLAQLGQGFALAITQAYATFDLVAQDAIFGHEVLIAYQQFLIDSPSDIGQQVLPVHGLPPQALSSLLTLSMGERGAEDNPETSGLW